MEERLEFFPEGAGKPEPSPVKPQTTEVQLTKINIQPTFIKYATKAEVKRFNDLTPVIQSKAWDLGATDAHVQKVPCGKDRFRYARVQFRCNGRYVGNIMI